jgi:hypothetical protein
LDLSTSYAAAAATQSKQGGSVMERLQKRLVAQAKGKSDG